MNCIRIAFKALNFKNNLKFRMEGTFKGICGVLLDMTGVLLESGASEAIQGSVEALRRLKDAGIPYRIVTNETVVDRSRLLNRLHSLGFTGIILDEIFAPAPLVAKVLKQRQLRPYLLVHPGVLPEFEGIETSNPNCVVVSDADEHFTYNNVNEAFRILMNIEKPLILAMGRGKYYKHLGQLTIDVGAYVAALECACDSAKVEVYGKPSQEFFSSALRDMNIPPNQVLMIGDDLVHDVGGAQNSGLKGVLVRTGKFRQSDCEHPIIKPDAVVDNLLAGIEMILENSSGN